MNGIIVPLKDAQKIKELLIKNNLMAKYRIIKNDGFIIFPIKNILKVKKIVKNADIIRRKFSRIRNIKNLKDAVKRNFTEKERKFLKKSFDIVGDIAILEVAKEIEGKEKLLAEKLMAINPRIKTVLKKIGGHTGVFRKQKMMLLGGEDKRETIHRENGIMIKVNVETVYFSARLSGERKRIAELVKPGEKVLVMFSGAAPYVCVIAKKTKAMEVVGIEINPEGHRYALENISLNKIKNARLYNGDVREIIPKLNEKFDRIIMPLPKSAENFLDIALSASKKGTIIHFYDFLNEKVIPHKSIKKIEDACKRNGIECKILNYVKCGQSAPREYRVCIDFEIV